MSDAGWTVDEFGRRAEALARAELDGDRDALEAALSPGFTAIGSDGRVWSRDAFLDRARGRRRLGAIDRGEVQIETAADAAVVTAVDLVRAPGSAARDARRLRTRMVWIREASGPRLVALDRVAVDAAPPALRRRRLRLLSWTALATALFFLVVAALHLGGRIPIGFVTLRQAPSTDAGVAEAVIGLALATAAYGLFAHGHCRHARLAWRWAVGVCWFAVLGVWVGLTVVSSGSGPSMHTNVLEHVLMLVLVVPELAALETPAGRAAVMPDAAAEL
jgi:hypothetical protein